MYFIEDLCDELVFSLGMCFVGFVGFKPAAKIFRVSGSD